MHIVFNYRPMLPESVFLKNIGLAKARNLPTPGHQKRPPLAIVGGGPSVLGKIDKLKAWKGDIWACGSAFPWIKEQGIKAIFFNIDPLPEQVEYANGAEQAILSSITDPSVFDAVPNIECFDLVATSEYTNHGLTAVMATPVLALEMGYTAVVYFGCEGSFDTTTHAYEYTNPHSPNMGIWVRCNGNVYPSSPQYLAQAQMLAEIIRTCPLVFREASGGLLRELIRDEKYEIIAVDQTTHDLMEFSKQDGTIVSRETGREMLPILNMAL